MFFHNGILLTSLFLLRTRICPQGGMSVFHHLGLLKTEQNRPNCLIMLIKSANFKQGLFSLLETNQEMNKFIKCDFKKQRHWQNIICWKFDLSKHCKLRGGKSENVLLRIKEILLFYVIAGNSDSIFSFDVLHGFYRHYLLIF